MTIKKAHRYSQYQVEPISKYSRCIIAHKTGGKQDGK